MLSGNINLGYWIKNYNSGNNWWRLGKNSYRNYEDHIAQLIKEQQLEPEYFYAEPGDMLIWHSQLFHGGSPIKDKSKTRKSLVTHYFTKEDFPDIDAPEITGQSCYMQRPAQPVAYDFKPAKSFFRRIFNSAS